MAAAGGAGDGGARPAGGGSEVWGGERHEATPDEAGTTASYPYATEGAVAAAAAESAVELSRRPLVSDVSVRMVLSVTAAADAAARAGLADEVTVVVVVRAGAGWVLTASLPLLPPGGFPPAPSCRRRAARLGAAACWRGGGAAPGRGAAAAAWGRAQPSGDVVGQFLVLEHSGR